MNAACHDYDGPDLDDGPMGFWWTAVAATLVAASGVVMFVVIRAIVGWLT